MRDFSQVRTLFADKGANGWSTAINVAPYRHIVLVISTSGNGSGTIKVAGSAQKASDVTFSSSASATNEWDYLHSYNLQTATGQTGDTGIVYAGTDAVEQILVNTDHMNTLAVQLSGYAAGKFNVKFFGANDSRA